jgi:hypothetical protein
VFSTCYLVTTRSLVSVVTETSVAVAHHRTSGSGSIIPAFSCHITLLFCLYLQIFKVRVSAVKTQELSCDSAPFIVTLILIL